MLVIAMLIGCGPGPDAFRERYLEAVCTQVEVCGDNTYDECIAALGDQVVSESYTPAAGAECLDAAEAVAEDCTDDGIAQHDACEGLLL